MGENRELKLFLTVLWSYIAGNIILFVSLISLEKFDLPLSIWYTLLIIDVGFVVVIFLPAPGMGVNRPVHIPPWRFIYPKWYPTTIGEIVEGGVRIPDVKGVKPPVRAVTPVPVVILLLLLVLTFLFRPGGEDVRKWRTAEVEKLKGVYLEAAGELEDIELTVARAGEDASMLLRRYRKGQSNRLTRVRLFSSLDSLAASYSKKLRPIYAMGVQLLDEWGRRYAWGGEPHYVDVAVPFREGVRFFTVRSTLYTLLVRVQDIPGEGRVIIDVPLEVNYRISNRFLRSVSLDEVLSEDLGEDVGFDYTVGEHRGETAWIREMNLPDTLKVIVSRKAAVEVYGFLFAPDGAPLAKLSVYGETYAAHLRGSENVRSFLSGLVVFVVVLILSVWVYSMYGKRRGSVERRGVLFLRRSILLAGLLVLLRYILLRMNLPGRILELGIFDPSLFADDFPFGLTRTAGDFLVTSLFSLILVFGVIKVFRTYYSGYLEMEFERGKKVSLYSLVWKIPVIVFVLLFSMWGISTIVTRVVLNSNPRLVGFDVDYFSLPFVALHLAMLFVVSSIVIAAVFVIRVIMLVKGSSLAGSLVISVVTIIVLYVLSGSNPMLVLTSAGVLTLAFRIFPVLRKDEVVSVIFAAFFLIMVVSLAIYSVADGRYEELRKSRIEEKAQEFLSPEDNWIKVVLPDICSDIARDRSIEQKIAGRSGSAAFEIWAGSPLSRLNLSCSFRVFDASGVEISSFKVGLPLGLGLEAGRSATGSAGNRHPTALGGSIGKLPDASGAFGSVVVQELRTSTRYGEVYYYRGVAHIRDFSGRYVGKVEIEIPYFFENTELLARAGPMAPEILHNIEKGALAPRVDEPEEMLVARVKGGFIVDASNPLLELGPVNEGVTAAPGDWFGLELGPDGFLCLMRTDEDGDGYIVGFREASFLEKLLQWAAVVSVDLVLTLLSLLVVIAIRRFPLLRGVVPSITPSMTLGFRQKILLSFLVVSIMPVVAIGIFSGKIMENRYREQSRKEALSSVKEAVEVLSHSIEVESDAFAISGMSAPRGGGGASGGVSSDSSNGFVLMDGGWRVRDSYGFGSEAGRIAGYLMACGPESGVKVLSLGRNLYCGVLRKIADGDTSSGMLFYARRMDDKFLRSIARVLNREVNLYFGGVLRATSERELFVGGFLNELLSPGVFRDIALGVRKEVVSRESLGDYEYSVASIPVTALGSGELAVLSVPLLYRPSTILREYRRSAALVLGLLTLLFASTVTLGVFLARRIFNPIEALQEGTRRIMEGDLEFALKARAPDEIGELVDSFNRMTGALRDARKKLTERQRYLSAVLENVATGVIATDRAGRIITINPAARRILSVGEGEITGLKPEEVTKDSLSPLLELLEATGEGRVREREVELVLDERRITLKAIVAELEAEGERLGSVMVFDDLTELIRSKKLAAWVEMARQIAHEVKNPLTPIKLSAQFMQRAYDDGSERFEEIFKEGIETIVTQAEILRRIASEFSNFGKVVRVKPEVFEVEQFLKDVLSPYRAAEGIEVSLMSSCGGVRAFADREALRKILVNFMENAVEAMPEGGRVVVECGEKGDMVEIRVLDSGIGLAPEVEKRLFEPYFSTKTNGTGLGLAISQSLAKEMGGRIVLRNRLDGKGVEAIVVVPVYRGD